MEKRNAGPTPVNRRKAKVSRMTREFSQVGAVEETQPSQYADSDTEMKDSDLEHIGNEDFLKADEVPAATSQRTEFFELSPK